MRQFIFLTFLGCLCLPATGQTLQSVTDNGNSTANTLTSTNPNGVQVIGTSGSPSYLVVDQTANPGGKRWRFGHTGAGPGFGSFDLYNITDNIIPFTIKSNGYIGLGTNNPSTTTEIKRTFPSGSQTFDFLRLTSSQPGAWFSQLGLQFRWEDTGNGVAYNVAQITAAPLWLNGTQSGGALQFWTKTLDASTTSELTEKMRITEAGNVGIGTTDTKGYRLAVNGKIRAQEIKVEVSPWPDYVFTKEYLLPSLQETERYIKEKGHLSGIPSAKEVEAEGINLGEMNTKLLQKIEELTLHLIEKDKEIQRQRAEINCERVRIDQIENLLKSFLKQ